MTAVNILPKNIEILVVLIYCELFLDGTTYYGPHVHFDGHTVQIELALWKEIILYVQKC